MWSLFIMFRYLLLLINSKIEWTEVQSHDQKMHKKCCVGAFLLFLSSHTLSHIPPLLQCHALKNGNLGSSWSSPNSLKQLHTKQGRTEQAGALSLPYMPWEALLWSQRQRTAWFEQHSGTQGTQMASTKSCHEPQPMAAGIPEPGKSDFTGNLGSPGRLGGSASSSLAPVSGCSWSSSVGNDCQAQLQLWAVLYENKECLKAVSDHGLHSELPDIHCTLQMERDNKTGSGKHLAAFPYPDLMGTVATTQ